MQMFMFMYNIQKPYLLSYIRDWSTVMILLFSPNREIMNIAYSSTKINRAIVEGLFSETAMHRG